MPHVTVSSTMDFNVAKILSSASIVTKSSTISLPCGMALTSKFYTRERTHWRNIVAEASIWVFRLGQWIQDDDDERMPA